MRAAARSLSTVRHETVVCSEPVGDDDTHKAGHKLGPVARLPHPLGFDLDTSEF